MTTEPDRNSKEAIREWVHACLKGFKGTSKAKTRLKRIGLTGAKNGLWRGDISDRWRADGFTSADIKDMY